MAGREHPWAIYPDPWVERDVIPQVFAITEIVLSIK